MKNKIFIIVGILALAILCFGTLYYMENSEEYFYTQIDNSKVEKLSLKDNMDYKYTLDCYNERGKKESISFKTYRKLKDKAFLKLKVLPVTGVNNWEEVMYSDLPKKVQEKYDN